MSSLPKYSKGSCVEVLSGWPRADLVGRRFFVLETEPNSRVRSMTYLGSHMAYKTPFISADKKDKAWVLEPFLKKVDFDEGFEFNENTQLYTVPIGEFELCQIQ